jgi:hypothetical protein
MCHSYGGPLVKVHIVFNQVGHYSQYEQLKKPWFVVVIRNKGQGFFFAVAFNFLNSMQILSSPFLFDTTTMGESHL